MVPGTHHTAEWGDFADPFGMFDLSSSPCNWHQGEYPPIDDIESWLHLFLIAVHHEPGTSSPIVPPVVTMFVHTCSELSYCLQIHGPRRFEAIYRAAEYWAAVRKEWFALLHRQIRDYSIEELVSHFPPGVRPLRTRAHPHPAIRQLSQYYSSAGRPPPSSFVKTPHAEHPVPPTPVPFRDQPVGPSPSVHAPHACADIAKTLIERPSSGEVDSIPRSEPRPSLRESHAHIRGGRISFEDIPAGEWLGSGCVRGRIGSGGTAVVYVIENSDLEVLRAVKIILLDKLCDTPEQLASMKGRVALEAKITGQMSHTNIVQLFAYGEFNGMPYLEMEYIRGLDLKGLIEKRGPLPHELTTAISIFAARALAYAHAQHYTIFGRTYGSIVHRDLKPGNILISDKGMVKVADWGMAKPAAVTMNTMNNRIVGTPGYMAPEQLTAGAVDSRADLYAIGVTMYEMITGTPMFAQRTILELMAARQQNRYRPVSELRRSVPRRLAGLVERCVRARPAERLPTAAALLDALESIHRKLTRKSPEAVLYDHIADRTRISPGKKTGSRMVKRLLGGDGGDY